jgi:diguanylate cyclase (GGDEF)-like protein/PAS domain S-box-containing protein
LAGRTDFAALLADPEVLRRILFACPEGVLATDEDGKIALFAGACEAIFGYEPAEVMGKDYRLLLQSDQAYDLLRAELAVHGRVANFEIPALRKRGAPFFAAISATPMEDPHGTTLGTIFYIRDHSGVRQVEDALRRNNAHLTHLVSTLDRLARHDQLTGLLRRGSAMEAAEEAIIVSASEGRAFGIALLDLDQFKLVNDSYGHLLGDKVLASLAGTLRSCARLNDIVGRFGGEEFVVFLPGADLEAVRAFAERVRVAIERSCVQFMDEVNVPITVSAGVASIPSCGATLTEALRVAVDRLYAATRAGRNQVVHADLKRDQPRSAA